MTKEKWDNMNYNQRYLFLKKNQFSSKYIYYEYKNLTTRQKELLKKEEKTDKELLKKATEALLSIDCQFSACEGFDKKPIDMKTCRRCWALYEIKQKYPEMVKETKHL